MGDSLLKSRQRHFDVINGVQMTSFPGSFYLRKKKEVWWGQAGTVERLCNRCNPDPGDVVVNDKGGVTGSIVLVKLTRILDVTQLILFFSLLATSTLQISFITYPGGTNSE